MFEHNIQLITTTVYICYFLQTFLITSLLSFSIIVYYEAEREIMYSLASMILVYLCIYPFFIYMRLDFIGTAFILVYVGAVAILFVFVIMTIEIKKVIFTDSNNILSNNSIITSKIVSIKTKNFISILFLVILGFFFIFFLNIQWWLYPFSWVYLNDYTAVLESLMYNTIFLSTYDTFIDSFLMTSFHHSINSLGSILYTSFYIELYIFSFVLFIAMVGSIVFFSTDKNKL